MSRQRRRSSGLYAFKGGLSMTGKEIFKKAVKLESTPRVPVIILSGGVWAYNQTNQSLQDSFDMPPEQSAQYWVEINEKIHSDLLWCAAGCNNLALRALGSECDFSKPGVAASSTPFLTKPGDVDKLDIGKIKEDPGVIAMLESTKLMKEKMGDEVMLAISQWGPMTLANLMFGATPFMKMLRKDPEGTKYVLDFTSEVVVEYWSLFAEAGAEHVSQAEPVASGDMISTKMFLQYAFPYLKKTNDAIGDKVFSKMIHICGNSSKSLEYLPDTGADMISMDYKVDLAFAREVLDGKMAFAGQVNPADVMVMSDADNVRKVSKECIEAAQWEKGGYILMPGCDLSPLTPLENVQAMTETAHSYTK